MEKEFGTIFPDNKQEATFFIQLIANITDEVAVLKDRLDKINIEQFKKQIV